MSLLDEGVFQELVADVFRDYGYTVSVAPGPGDYGADLIIEKDDRKAVVHARKNAGSAGVDAVRDAHFAKHYYGADEAWVVSASGFTSEAVSTADGIGVHLVTGEGVQRLMEECTFEESERVYETAADELAPIDESAPADKPTPVDEPAPADDLTGPQQLVTAAVHDGQLTLAISDKTLFTFSGEERDELIQYHGQERDVVIPSGLGIWWIGSYAFGDPYRDWEESCDLRSGLTMPVCDWKSIRSVVIPEGVVAISFGAFSRCTSLQTVALPSTLKFIGPHAFEGCTSLRYVAFPDSLQEIGSSAFGHCKSLREIRFPQSLESIGGWAFEGCDGLRDLVIQRDQGKLEIGAQAFANSGVTALTMGGNIAMSEGCFQRCLLLESVEIKNPNDDESLFSTKVAGESDCRGLETLPESTFEQCIALKSVDLPTTLQSVGDKAFSYCGKLTDAYLPDGVREIGSRAFCGCSSLSYARIPADVEIIRIETFSYCKMLSGISFSDGLKTIEERAFRKCEWLQKVALPSSVEEVASRAFEDCERLSKVTIEGEGCCGTFYRSAFMGCPVLEESTPINNLPNTATLVNDAAFPEMFDGPAHELRALRFETYDYENPFPHLSGFFIVDSGIQGLNRFSGEAVNSGVVEFWIQLDDGCNLGYFALKGTFSSGEEYFNDGYLKPKSYRYSTDDPTRHGSGSLVGDFSVYLSGCHIVPSPGIDGARAARVEEDYRRGVTPLVDEFW
jgi:hypothetical protein